MYTLSHIRILFISILFFISHAAWAGAPFVTDDPEPVEYKHLEINLAVNASRSGGDTEISVPNTVINYGFSPDVQVHVLPKLTYKRTNDGNYYRIDNTEIGIKYRFVNSKLGDSNWMVGIYPILLLPTADKTLDPEVGKMEKFLPISVQRDTADWTIYGGVGYRLNQGIDAKNSYFIGIAALNHITKNFHLGGEVFHETPSKTNEKATVGFNVGGKYDLSDNYHVLFSAGKALVNVYATNQFSVYLALQATY